jgi:hypothetical protein
MRPPRKALDRAPGHRLADICGGTANYALALKREGWERPWSTALPRCFAQDDLRASPPAPSLLPLRTTSIIFELAVKRRPLFCESDTPGVPLR